MTEQSGPNSAGSSGTATQPKPHIGFHEFESELRHSPVVLRTEAKRAESVQLKVADKITAFAGSMSFFYLHAVIFALWMLFVEKSPWQKLTLIVSLEAIFLSTFVMIGQNRQASFQQAKADHDFFEQESELKKNTEITQAIHNLAAAIHASVCDGTITITRGPAPTSTMPEAPPPTDAATSGDDPA